MADSAVDRIDKKVTDQVTALRDQATQEATAIRNSDVVNWFMPKSETWDKDLTKPENFNEPFSRKDLNENFKSLVDNQKGVVGDGICIALQVDWLALLERAFRARHTMSRPRAVAHATSRKQGHGAEDGTISQVVLEHVRGIMKRSKS